MITKISRTLRVSFLTAAFVFALSFTASSAEYVNVIKDGVNVRTGPGTSNPVYMELFAGYPLKVIEEKDNWLKVTDFEEDSGWIYAPLTQECDTVIVDVSSKANMRSGPTTEDGVIATVERGVVLELVTRKSKWVEVKHRSGTQGWIYAPLLWPR